MSCFERIWESTSLLTAEQLQHLTDGFELLRHDYRLRYRGKRTSVDLVDPFMHGLVYGLTPAYGAHDTLHIEPPPLPLISDWYAQSPNFAFIPTSFKVSMTDKPLTVKAQSYINDIYPSVTGLYPPIESTLASTIPVFEYVLTDLHRTNPLRQRIRGSCRYTEWDEPDEPEHSDDEEGWMRYEREVRQWTLHRPLEIPDIPGDGYIGGLEKRNHYVSLRGRTVKVVVKVTDIHLVSCLLALIGFDLLV